MNYQDRMKSIMGYVPAKTSDLLPASLEQVPMTGSFSSRSAIDGIEVLPEYEKVLALLDAGVPVVSVYGEAGTGKTTFIRYLQHCRPEGSAVAAFTGIAALNISGTTIHSLFHFPPYLIQKKDVEDSLKRVKNRHLYKSLKLLILDEVSMVRADIIDGIDLFLRSVRNENDLPFGGVQIIMVGDLLQLPPVTKEVEEKAWFREQYQTPLCFGAHVLAELQIPPVFLKRIFRQKDPLFIALLNRVRVGDGSGEVIRMLDTRVGAAPKNAVTLTLTNADADQINEQEMNRISGREVSFNAEVKGDSRRVPKELPVPALIRLKKGARVMFTRNDPQRRWVNGTTGTVVQISSVEVTVRLDETGLTVAVRPMTWQLYRYDVDMNTKQLVPKIDIEYTQVPLVPAWACTIHKSQGKTLSTIHLSLSGRAFAEGQIYVALSRCTTFEGITLSRSIRSEEIFAHPVTMEYLKMLEAMIPAESDTIRTAVPKIAAPKTEELPRLKPVQNEPVSWKKEFLEQMKNGNAETAKEILRRQIRKAHTQRHYYELCEMAISYLNAKDFVEELCADGLVRYSNHNHQGLSFSEAARIAYEILNNYPAAVLFIKRGASVLRGNREEIRKLAAVAGNVLGDLVLAEQIMNK